MLSFEVSVIDIVLAIAIIVILLLQVKKTSTKSTAEPEASIGKRKPLQNLKNVRAGKAFRKQESYNPFSEDPADCPHRFGHLKTLPLGSSVPENCYSCPRVTACLAADEQAVRVSF
jgi:hypothetical protein